MFNKRLKFTALVALLWATSFSAVHSAQKEVSESSLKSSLSLVENLLTKSSLVQRVKEAGSAQAVESLEQAQSLHKQALNYLNVGDLPSAQSARDEAMKSLMLAGRLANEASGYSKQKPKADFEKKLQSVEALLAAHKRITDDNKDVEKEKSLHASVSPLLDQSKVSATKQQFKEAIASLDKAYLIIASSIKSQRTGLTLVRSLDFATKEEAFEYELGRYENYKMLVNMLIEERGVIKRDEKSKPFFDKANNYYNQAMELVKKDQHEQAGELIEKASKTLVKLMQASGIYIPGQ